MTSPSLADDEIEIIRHFVEDLYKYEYLILERRIGSAGVTQWFTAVKCR